MLLACPDPPWNGRVWYIRNGHRRWAASVDHLTAYGLKLSDTIQASDAEIRSYGLGGHLPMPWNGDSWHDPPRTSRNVLRELACSRCRGTGVEFGAGTSPMPTPVDCDVQFADFIPEADVRARKEEAGGDDFATLDYVMGIEDPHLIPDGSVNFVVASHVIEHIRNPLRAFEAIYRKLRPGGQFVLVVPDKNRTFDRDRPLTTLEHLILDYHQPDLERDKQHYREFFEKVYGMTDDLDAKVESVIAINGDTHFHVWNYQTFGEFVTYSQRSISPWSEVWSQPAIDSDPDSFEFYYVLTR
jgi:SAM-dependent methyltransferase